MKLPLLILLSLAPLAACTTAPVARIPEPLPEALEWARPPSEGAFLGLKTRENDSGSLDSLFFDPGVRVSRVVENSPADVAGVEAGDVILALGEHEVNDPAALDTLVAEAGPGASVQLRVQRADSVFQVPVTLRGEDGEAREVELLYRVDASRSRAGWLTGRGGAVLASVAPGGPAAEAGLEVGLVVTAVEGGRVASARALIRELERYEPGTTVALTVSEEGMEREVELTLADAPRQVTGVGFPILFHYDATTDGAETSFVLIDLYFISLFRYTRVGAEREYRALRWIRYASGVGELAE